MANNIENENDRDSVGWVPGEATTLESLLSVVNASALKLDKTGVPWRSGHQLTITGQGGLYDREDRRVSIVRGEYKSEVYENISSEITGNYSLKSEGQLSLTLAASDAIKVTNPGVIGSDILTVYGDANITAWNKFTQCGNLQVVRTWHGGIVRIGGLEGVICGGAYAHVVAGPYATISFLSTTDVYGLTSRSAGARLNVAGLIYRSTTLCNFNTYGAYFNHAKLRLVPPSPGNKPEKPTVTKRKLASVGILGLCPMFEILFGLVMLVVGAIGGIVSLIRSVKKYKTYKAEAPKPRNYLLWCVTSSATLQNEMSS